MDYLSLSQDILETADDHLTCEIYLSLSNIAPELLQHDIIFKQLDNSKHMKPHVLQELSCILCNIITCGDRKSAVKLMDHVCALQVLVQCLGLDQYNMPIFKHKFVLNVISTLN